MSNSLEMSVMFDVNSENVYSIIRNYLPEIANIV